MTSRTSIIRQNKDLAIKAGLGKLHPLTENSRHGVYRNEIPAVHGLRKFTITQMAKAKVDTEIATADRSFDRSQRKVSQL